jgi:hypothetical protein
MKEYHAKWYKEHKEKRLATNSRICKNKTKRMAIQAKGRKHLPQNFDTISLPKNMKIS